MNEFYNPYAFIPVTGKVNGNDTPTTNFKRIKEGEHSHVRHDLWTKDSFSGRLVCSLFLETPTLVGNQHTEPEDSGETLVTPYKGIDERFAIPANSIRGMISSTAETLSQSSLRVLQKADYSIRQEAGEGLSAIGILSTYTRPDGKNALTVRPLCLPLLDRQTPIPDQWLSAFEGLTLAQSLSAYVDGYEPYIENQSSAIQLSYRPGSFLEKHRPNCYHDKQPVFWYAKVNHALLNTEIGDSIPRNSADLKSIGHWVIGQELVGDDILSEQEYLKLRDTRGYIRGVLHVLGIDGREDLLPVERKKHERFLPWPIGHEPPHLLIRSAAWQSFLRTAELRAETSKKETDARKLPLQPHINLEYKGNFPHWRPRPGELVYFSLDEQGGVDQISYTAIWRRGLDDTIHDAFRRLYPDSLPWGTLPSEGLTARAELTPVETLFGVVAAEKIEHSPQSSNLASRVRFADAFALKPVTQEPEKPFKILSSPKPPSPAIYFREGGTISKNRLKLSEATPNGRKYYLPHANTDNKPWHSRNHDNRKQKMRGAPFSAGQTFYFHADFENLSEEELTLLHTSLVPGPEFRHRLGLGKPLGLGSVKVGICGIFLIDRIARYDIGNLEKPRFHSTADTGGWPEELNDRYPDEAVAAKTLPPVALSAFYDGCLVDQNTLDILLTLGDPSRQKPGVPVCYPFSEGQEAYGETEGFTWFTVNEKLPQSDVNSTECPARTRQGLEPVTAGSDLKPLRKNIRS